PVSIRHRIMPVTADELDPATGEKCRDLAKSLLYGYSPIRKLMSKLGIIGHRDASKPDQCRRETEHFVIRLSERQGFLVSRSCAHQLPASPMQVPDSIQGPSQKP